MKKKNIQTVRGNKENIYLDLKDVEQTAKVCRALSSQTRLEILRYIANNAMTISQLSEIFNLPMSSMSLHIKTLKDAELIDTFPKPGLHGTQKLCSMLTSKVSVSFYSHLSHSTQTPPVYVEMPIGLYTACNVTPPCGIATTDFYIYEEDSPHGFYSAERHKAEILWFTKGRIEYQFPNAALLKGPLKQIEFSFEICSEAPGFNHDWPSDVDVELNGKCVTTLHITGDYGDRRGVFNPSWWNENYSQYGELRTVRITYDGVYTDQKKVSDETIETLGLKDNYSIAFALNCNTESKYTGGGINLFGKHFGDYDQDIVMKVEYF